MRDPLYDEHPEVKRRMTENPGLGAVQAINQIKMERALVAQARGPSRGIAG